MIRMKSLESALDTAATYIISSRWLTAFTGAGVSAESGIPTFRGTDGIWNEYNPDVLEISYFRAHPKESWIVIRDLFYEKFRQAEPNPAHKILAAWEKRGLLKQIITQNIDDLHYRAGNRSIIEYHGNSRLVRCLQCGKTFPADSLDLSQLPPVCTICGGLLKPDFVFFGESIPPEALSASIQAMEKTDCLLVIGTTGEVYPAASLPRIAKKQGAFIIEVNPQPSAFTFSLVDAYIPLPAGEAFLRLEERIQATPIRCV